MEREIPLVFLNDSQAKISIEKTKKVFKLYYEDFKSAFIFAHYFFSFDLLRQHITVIIIITAERQDQSPAYKYIGLAIFNRTHPF